MGSPSSSFQNVKNLRFVIALAQQRSPFVENGTSYNTITLDGLRASVFVNNGGGAMMGTMNAQIFGLTDSQLNTLTSPQWDSLTLNSTSGENLIQVYAIDGATETLVYKGQILNAWGVYTSMPEVYLYIQAIVGFEQLTTPASPLSIATPTSLDVVMGQIASQMGFRFENNGVTGTVAKGTYVANTLMEQARNLQMAYKFWMYLDGNTLAIAPAGQARKVAAPLISPQTGLIGYPMFNRYGINFDTLYNPGIVFGGPVNVQSSVASATGEWIVNSVSHQLTSQTPGGPWLSTIFATAPKFTPLFLVG